MLTIYSARTGRIRRLVIDAERTDPYLLARHAPGTGEAVHKGSPVTQEQLSAITGLTPANDRYVVKLGASHVVERVLGFADPDAGDSVRPGRTMVAHPLAEVDWRQNLDNTFERSVPAINRDITQLEASRTQLDSAENRAREAATPDGGLTDAEIDARVAAYQPRIDAKVAERTARQGPRH